MSSVSRTHKIKIELTKLLFQELQYALWAESFVAIALAIVLWNLENHKLVVYWLGFNLIFCGLARHLMLFFYNRSTAKQELTYKQMQRWKMLFAIGAFISGVSWGAVAGFLMVKTDLLHQLFEIILLIGISAGANSFYYPSRKIYTIFLLTTLTPLIVWFTLQGSIFIALTILGILFIIVMLIASYHTNNLIYKSLQLGFQNSALVDDLSTAKISLEHRSNEIEKTLSLVNATLEATTDGILVVDSNNKVESFNQNFLDMWKIPLVLTTEFNADEKMIAYVKEHLVDPVIFEERIKQLYANPFIESFDELLFKDGRVFERYSKPQLVHGKCVGRVWSFRDITGRKLLESKLYKQANFDSLTGLPNRVLVRDRISQAILHANPHNLIVAVLFVDLDRFKMINDTLGHFIGDKLLKSVAERLTSCVKLNDTVSRIGGDEFVVILNSLKNENDAIDIARHCLQLFTQPFVIDENKFSISLSIGISFYPQDGVDPEILIRNADIAMYRAKELGNNFFLCFTEELNNKVQSRLFMESQLRDALLHHQLSVLYQPIICLKTGRIIGAEALMRWDHPTLGSISPSEFISIAEECGMIIPIGEWILRAACTQTYEWHQGGFENLYISVNLSARQFSQINLLEKIQIILKETKLNSNFLILELTESSLMDNIDANIKLLKKLKETGIMLAIDDFGIGYSSLNYLKQLPIDKLKIDISFIKDITLHADGAAITAAIIALASKLNLKVIAEGVEDREQLIFLVSHRCDEMQGFYFSKPLDADAYLKLIKTNPVVEIP